MAVSRDEAQDARHRSEHSQVSASPQRWRLFRLVSRGGGVEWSLGYKRGGQGARPWNPKEQAGRGHVRVEGRRNWRLSPALLRV